ncbi:cytochrome-c peroxidase [Desulfosediminicola flagellatus]|uniref:cytochrome-c peroxidase n=1 Tax=Desulfosediminicola flagellatus TaxID=2569541 RepID=UPI0010AC1051|nr:cytochrome c peroxidase [Desulfosediminicola flagellatus]
MKKKNYTCVLALPLVYMVSASNAVALSRMEDLGRQLYEETNFSDPVGQSCQTCHSPESGFADPQNAISPEDTFVSIGADGESTGGRNAPTAAYAGYSPMLHKSNRGWRGGLFWDGRADGTLTGDPLADQAQGPPLNPVEMNSTKERVVAVISQNYAKLFMAVFGRNSLDDVDQAYTYFSIAVAAFERSTEVQQFSSAFDNGYMTPEEKAGEALFRNNCTTCHAMTLKIEEGPLFTNYGYANIGLPANITLPGYDPEEPDLGLGVTVGDDRENGKFKIPTLRNVSKTAPYGHNGYFSTLTDMVSFLNSRDSSNEWADPEYPFNLSENVGNMLLTDQEVDLIVTFLGALDDQ